LLLSKSVYLIAACLISHPFFQTGGNFYINMINKAIKFLRQINRSLVKDMARELGISSSYLSELEAGKKKVSLDIVKKYSEILNIDPGLIFKLSQKIKDEEKFNQDVFKAVIEVIEKWLYIWYILRSP